MLGLPHSRSGLRRLVVAEILNRETPGEDVARLWELLKAYGIHVCTSRGDGVGLISPGLGSDEEPWLLVSDGGLRGHRRGVGLVLARHGTIVAVRGYGLLVHAGSSTMMEWIAKALLLLVTAHLTGKRILVADSAAGAFTGASLPHYHTWVDALAKKALKSINLEEYSEGWVQAKHDNGMKEFLALCNEHADFVATEQSLAAQVGPFPIQEQWASGPILQVDGRYVVDPDASLDKLYDDAMVHRAAQGLHGWSGEWSSYDHVRAVKGGEVSRESHRMLMLLRVLGTWPRWTRFWTGSWTGRRTWRPCFVKERSVCGCQYSRTESCRTTCVSKQATRSCYAAGREDILLQGLFVILGEGARCRWRIFFSRGTARRPWTWRQYRACFLLATGPGIMGSTPG